MTAFDARAAEGRRELLRRRIASDRTRLRSETAALREATRPAALLRSSLGPIGRLLAARRGRRGLGTPGVGAGAGGLALALTLLRRYRLAVTLAGALVPVWRRRRAIRRIVRFGAIGVAAWFGWRALARRRP